MYISSGINYVVIVFLLNLLTVYLVKFDIYIIIVYRPPSYIDEENINLLNYLSNFCGDKEVIILGDFNLPTLNWRLDDLFLEYIQPLDLKFLDLFTELGLMQIVKESTFYPSGSTLDLVLVTHSERIGSCKVLDLMPRCHHTPIIICYVFQISHELNYSVLDCDVRLWTRGNYLQLGRIFENIDWYSELNNLSPALQYSKFLSIVSPLIERFVPLKSYNSTKVPWSLNPPRSLKNERSQRWNDYKSARCFHGRFHQTTLDAWSSFRCINERIFNFAYSSQIEYEKKIGNQINTQPKLFHSYIKHRRVGRPAVGPIKLPDDSLTDEPLTMANCFAEAFSSVFDNSVLSNPFPHQVNDSTIDQLTVTNDMVVEAIKSLKANSAVGEDGIHPRLLQALANILADHYV